MDYTQLIVEMYKNNIGIKKISKVLKISVPEIYQHLRKGDILRDNTNQRNEQICSLYDQQINITEIAEMLGINRHTVTNILKETGDYKWEEEKTSIDSPNKAKRNDAILSLYKTGLSVRQIGKQLNICSATVYNILKYFNAEIRPQHQQGHSKGTSKNRKHFFDTNYFKKIDSEEKAYWLGFLYADGCVIEKGVLILALQERDKGHLEKFKKSLNANTTKLEYCKNTKSYRLSFSSVELVNDLVNVGCVAKKSLILEFPNYDQVPQYLTHHFMRGYFDGDGCISISKKSNSCFSLLGTPKFLDEYERHLLLNIGRNKPNKRSHQDSWNDQTEQVQYGGKKQIKRIFEYLYKDATVYLERKYNKFNVLLSS